MNAPLKMLFNIKSAIFSVIFSIWLLCCCLPSGESLVVPQELPSILSLIYSNIPPIKKGTDSRLGFGFRLGNHADFQVLLELGPQKNTRPIGENADSENTFNKRQVSKAQRDYLRRKQAQEALKQLANKAAADTTSSGDHSTASWLQTWSNAMNSNSKESNNNNNDENGSKASNNKKKFSTKYSQSVVKKETQQQPVQSAPTAIGEEHSMLQLQKLYQMASTTITPTDGIIKTTTAISSDNSGDNAVENTTSTTAPPQLRRLHSKFVPFKSGSLSYGGASTAFLPPRSPEELALQIISEKQKEKKSKGEITKELMDVSLDSDQ